MGKRSVIVLAAICVALMFSAGAIYAGTDVKDVFKMERPEYKEHKKAIVEFTHKKHADEYKIGCGECHHDDKGKPIEGLKMGDDVQKCIECHKIPAEAPKGKKAKKKLTKKEKIKDYHAEALHANCKGCHKSYNKKYKPKKYLFEGLNGKHYSETSVAKIIRH